MIFILIAILGGASIVIARIFNANLAGHIGLVEGSFYNYLTGLFGSVLIGAALGEMAKVSLTLTHHSVPPWAYLGGLIGLAVVLMSSAITPKMSSLYMTLFIFLGQLGSGLLIDWILEGSWSLGKITGGVLVLLGLCYNLYLDQKIKK